MQRILTINGGGIRGLLPATWLLALERKTGKQAYQLFDLIAGTSTGAIVGACLVSGIPAIDIQNFFLVEGPKIFEKRFGEGILQAKYSSDMIEELLAKYLGTRTLSQALTPYLATAYDVRTAKDHVFTSFDKNPLPLAEAARASSAAPTYFPTKDGFVDGGVFANNPSVLAILESANDHPMDQISVLNLGTGGSSYKVPNAINVDWGVLEWAKHMPDVFMDSGADTTSLVARHLIKDRYVQFDAQLPLQIGMDDASRTTLNLLKSVGEKSQDEFVAVAERFLTL
jgi:patatin-like phospholipase/acyl hydrolase